MESVDMDSLFFMATLPAELLSGDAPTRTGEADRPTWGDLAEFAARRALDAVLSLGAQI